MRTLLATLALMVGSVTLWADDEEPTATQKLVNGGFEQGDLGQPPTGWHFLKSNERDVCRFALTEDKPFAGKRSVELSRAANDKAEPEGPGIGNVMQMIDAKPYRGKRVRFKAAVRADITGETNQVRLWLRVDRKDGALGFFDNMAKRPILEKNWQHYEIVGDVAKDAELISLGFFLLGNGKVGVDDATFDIVDRSVPLTVIEPGPGLMEVRMAAKVTSYGSSEATFLHPLPLAYRDQVPLTFALKITPPECAKSATIVPGSGSNRLLSIELTNLKPYQGVTVEYSAAILVGPTKYATLPKTAAFPEEWPAEAKPWLATTWCCDADHERIRKLATEAKGNSKDVLATIRKVLKASNATLSAAEGRVKDLTAVEALDHQGSCTSNANLLAALLRAAGVPARVLAGYPLWSGPLQTHYIVEAYVPGFGWYPLESTRGDEAWPNYQQVNVSIVPPEHESKAKAASRANIGGAVPYQTVAELADPKSKILAVGTLKPMCDHECRMLRPLTADEAIWAQSLTAGKTRWDAWLKSPLQLEKGQVTFGPAATKLNGETPVEVLKELK